MTFQSSSFGSFQRSGFHTPMPGLFADLDEASGHVALPEQFLGSPAEVRVRVINQWQHAFAARRNEALVDMFREFAKPLQHQTIIAQVEKFRRHCQARGITCPPDFALMLQRF